MSYIKIDQHRDGMCKLALEMKNPKPGFKYIMSLWGLTCIWSKPHEAI